MNAVLVLFGPFGMGLLNMGNPCVLPLYPGFIAYLAGSSPTIETSRITRWLGIIVLAGVLVSMLLVGFIIALLQVAMGAVLAIFLPLISIILVVMGLLMVLDKNPFARFTTLHATRSTNPLISSFLYGLLYGPMTLPCSGPMIIGIFAYGASDMRSVVDSLLYMVAYGAGFGLPLVILPLLASAKQKAVVQWLARHHIALTRTAGMLLVIIGILNLANQWELIRHYWML